MVAKAVTDLLIVQSEMVFLNKEIGWGKRFHKIGWRAGEALLFSLVVAPKTLPFSPSMFGITTSSTSFTETSWVSDSPRLPRCAPRHAFFNRLLDLSVRYLFTAAFALCKRTFLQRARCTSSWPSCLPRSPSSPPTCAPSSSRPTLPWRCAPAIAIPVFAAVFLSAPHLGSVHFDPVCLD